ncbi:hypothetical protein D9M68_680170 [compost metagenome]
MGQHVGADQDAALDLVAEAFRPRAADHFVQVAVLGGAVAVAHAVVAGQVAGRFGGGDHVVGGDGQLGARQRDRHAHGAQRFELGQRGFDRGGHVRRQAGAEIFLGHADAQALERLAAGGVETALRGVEAAADPAGFVHGIVALLQAGGVARVEAADDVQELEQVAAAGGQRAGLVQAGAEGHHAVARYRTVRGLDAADAAQGGGLAHRAAGVGAGGGCHQAGRHGSGGAARGAAGHGGVVPGVLHGAVRGVLVAGTHGEFIAVQLAQRHGAGLLQPFHDGGVEGADVAVEHLAAGGGAPAAGDERVLVGDRDAGQRAGRAGRQRRVGGAGLGQRQFGVNM